jgi:hypothetical protein
LHALARLFLGIRGQAAWWFTDVMLPSNDAAMRPCVRFRPSGLRVM